MVNALQPTHVASRYVVRQCPDPRRAPGRHAYTVLSYQIAGEVRLEQNGPLAIHGGDFHVVPAGQAHRLTHAVDAERWSVSIATARLDPERFADTLAPIERMTRGALPRVTVPVARRAFVTAHVQAPVRGCACRMASRAALSIKCLGPTSPCA